MRLFRHALTATGKCPHYLIHLARANIVESSSSHPSRIVRSLKTRSLQAAAGFVRLERTAGARGLRAENWEIHGGTHVRRHR